jgi:ATP-dependent DNA helicase RecQ
MATQLLWIPQAIFGDVTLRDLARKIPSTPNELLDISGIGMKKLEQYEEQILEIQL